MTLSELTDYVCTKSGLIEDDDREACKQFLSKRYELIYNSYLWKDALVAVDIAVDPTTNEDHAEGIVLVQEVIDRVVAVRTPDQGGSYGNSVRIRGLEDYYRIDMDQFSMTGVPTSFALLSPIWFVWRGFTGLQVVAANPADYQTPMKVTWRDSSGKRYVQLLQHGSLLNDSNTTEDTDVVVVSGAGTSAINGVYTSSTPESGYDAAFLRGATVSDDYWMYIGTVEQKWTIRDVVGNIQYQRIDTGTSPVASDWTESGFSGAAPVPTTAYGETARIEIESVFKPATIGEISFSPQISNDADGDSLDETLTRSPAYQRLRLFSIPTTSMTLSVLGKKKFVPLDFDEEEPEIKNLDNCLIAFAMGDMYTRARFPESESQPHYQEGAILLQELAKLETIQAANNSRFIPDNGYMDEWGGPSQSGIWF